MFRTLAQFAAAVALPLCTPAAFTGAASPTVPAAQAPRQSYGAENANARTAARAAILDRLAASATQELTQNILPFWLAHSRDLARGGFHGEIANDLTVRRDVPRGALLTCRILWTFSAAMRREKDRAEYREMARWAYDDLLARFWDEKHGGLYWTVRPDGSPLASHKQVYLQSFGIYALSEYHRATGDAAALERAIGIHRLLEQHARDRRHGGYLEAYSRDWRRELPEFRRIIGGTAPKSQNTHLHIMEAYASLMRVWPDDGLRAAQHALIDEVMLTRVLDPETHHLGLFFEMDWKPASVAISYGHDIEAAWLLCEAAEVLGDDEILDRTRRAAIGIARATLREGVSPEGAIYNEGDPRGVTDRNHDWWPQAEAAVGFIHAYSLSGDVVFLQAADAAWRFIEGHLIDRVHGGWFQTVAPDGAPLRSRPKVSLWKCPYHNARACMELIDRTAALRREGRAEGPKG